MPAVKFERPEIDVEVRVAAIKNTWTRQEKARRRAEAEHRQKELARMLGLTLVPDLQLCSAS